MPETRINTGFRHFSPLFKLNRSWWFARQIVEYSVYASYLVDDSAHYRLEDVEWNVGCLGGHEVNGVDCAERNGIIVGTLIAHDSDGTHIGKGSEVLAD